MSLSCKDIWTKTIKFVKNAEFLLISNKSSCRRNERSAVSDERFREVLLPYKLSCQDTLLSGYTL